MGPSAPLLLFFFLSWTGPLQGQQHHLVEYMERRLAALEVRDLFLFSPGWDESASVGATSCQGSGSDKKSLTTSSLLITL